MNKRFLLATMALTSALALTACGSDSDAESGAGSGSAEPKPVAYDGPAKDLPENFPVPEATGEQLTIGYLQIYGALPTLAVQQRGAEARAEELGVELIVKDAELNPQKQVTQFDELLAEGVDAIVVYPVVPESLGPALAEAEAAGIPVIATNARPDVSKPLGEGYDADLEAPIDRQAYAMAEYGAKEQPGGSFGIIGNAAPIAALKYMAEREQYWGERFGLEFVGLVDSKEDTAAGYGPAVSELIAKNPDIDQIWVYNDLVALTAATVVKSSGLDDVLIIANSGTGEAVMEAIKAGDIAMSYQVPWAAQGEALINAAYSSVTDQNLPLPETVSLLGTAITADNVDDATPTE
ncbi:sugar ABC transporter xylitol/D-threitol-binding protein ThpA [Nocardioides hungaricus]